MRYFDDQQKVGCSQRINEYATKIQRLEHDKYLPQKRIADLERKNKTLKGANNDFNRALKTRIESIDGVDEIKEKKLKEILCIV